MFLSPVAVPAEVAKAYLIYQYITLAIFVVLAIVIIASKILYKKSPFLDYSPDEVQPCPAGYRCGAETLGQVKLENDLWARLRETEQHTPVGHAISGEQIEVLPHEAEPTSCLLRRTMAEGAIDGALPEGNMKPTYEEIESSMLKLRRTVH